MEKAMDKMLEDPLMLVCLAAVAILGLGWICRSKRGGSL
jgi:hypothetical protein